MDGPPPGFNPDAYPGGLPPGLNPDSPENLSNQLVQEHRWAIETLGSRYAQLVSESPGADLQERMSRVSAEAMYIREAGAIRTPVAPAAPARERTPPRSAPARTGSGTASLPVVSRESSAPNAAAAPSRPQGQGTHDAKALEYMAVFLVLLVVLVLVVLAPGVLIALAFFGAIYFFGEMFT